MPSLGSASCAVAASPSQESRIVMLMKPGPLTSALATIGDAARRPAICAATSRGCLPSRLASARATFAWKSANVDGRISGSVPA